MIPMHLSILNRRSEGSRQVPKSIRVWLRMRRFISRDAHLGGNLKCQRRRLSFTGRPLAAIAEYTNLFQITKKTPGTGEQLD
jgi:hypothetical protein